jgi:succinyl-CoA synthetase beta subunit
MGPRHEHPRISGEIAPAEFGAPVSDGRAVLHAPKRHYAAESLPGPIWVVKAQIHAGGRGKGRFKESEAGSGGGVRIGRSRKTRR